MSAVQPFFAGVPTFFRAATATVDVLSPGDIAIVGAPFDSTNTYGRAGARYGPRAIREASCYYASFYQSMPDRTIVDLDSGTEYTIPEALPLYDLGDVDCYPTDLAATTEAVAELVASVVAAGAFPITIGGDHWIAYPGWRGVADGLARSGREDDLPLGLLQVDSHTDLFDEMIFTGRHNHATFARRIAEEPRASVAHMAWLGLNGRLVSREQYDFATTNGLTMLTSSDLMVPEWEDRVDDVIARVASCPQLYATLDIDAVDGSVAPGTTATIFDGIDAARFVRIAEKLAEVPNLAGLDLCEVAPNLDSSGRTARLAALALVSFVGAKLFPSRPVA